MSERNPFEDDGLRHGDVGVDFFVDVRADLRIHVRILHGHFQVYAASTKLCDIEYEQVDTYLSMDDLRVNGGVVHVMLFGRATDYHGHQNQAHFAHRGYRWLRRQFGWDLCVIPYPTYESFNEFLAWEKETGGHWQKEPFWHS